jgi:FMN phosphatase YigB (HAD superfamily)/precorrin-6B methylase 2
MAAKSAAGSGEVFWDEYDHSYVRSVGVPDDDIAAAARALSGTRNAYLWRWPIPESQMALAKLAAADLPMGVVSNASGQIAEVLSRSGVCQAGYGPHVSMRVIVDSQIVGVAKPDPAIFEHALAYFDGIDRHEIAYIGDSVTMDIGASTAAGLHPILLDPYDDHPEADFERIHSLVDLTEDEYGVSRSWSQWRAATDLQEYHTRWQRLEATGESTHGEADFIQALHPSRVLDAGCGMGRVAIELARRGLDVVGVDLDDDLLTFARQSEPSIRWVHADLATMRLGRMFDVVAMPGNVMIFCRPADRPAIIRNAAAHLDDDGLLVAGFDLLPAAEALTLAEYDELCAANGLELVQRCSTWQADAYQGGPYAVSVHRRRR